MYTLEQFAGSIEGELQRLLPIRLKSVPQLAGRPVADEERYEGKVVMNYELTTLGMPATLLLGIRVFIDQREGMPVMAIAMYDNVVAGKLLADDMVYRDTIVMDPRKDPRISTSATTYISTRMNAWFYALQHLISNQGN